MDTSSGKRNKADRADASRDSCLYLGDFNRQRLSPGMKPAERHFPFGVPGGSGRSGQVMKTIEKIKRKKQSAKQAKVDRKLLRQLAQDCI